MDNSTLIATVGQRLNRSDLTSLIPDFIARAEDEIFAKLAANPVRPMQKSFGYPGVTAQNFAVPSDFIDMIDLFVTDGADTWQMVRIDISDVGGYYATRALPYRTEYDSTKIRHYKIIGSSVFLSGTPTVPLGFTLRYFARPDGLASASTNWVSINHADVYEFGTLMHAARHIRDDNLEDRMADRFAAAFDLLTNAYPEHQNPSELRATDFPMAIQTWNIYSG